LFIIYEEQIAAINNAHYSMLHSLLTGLSKEQLVCLTEDDSMVDAKVMVAEAVNEALIAKDFPAPGGLEEEQEEDIDALSPLDIDTVSPDDAWAVYKQRRSCGRSWVPKDHGYIYIYILLKGDGRCAYFIYSITIYSYYFYFNYI